MGQLLVRGIEDGVIARLKARAAENDRSMEAEHREILRAALPEEVDWLARRADVIKRMAELRAAKAGRTFTPSEILQREGREER